MILDDNYSGAGEISEATKQNIQSMVGWIKFLSIFNIVINALSAISTLSSGRNMSGLVSNAISIYLNIVLFQSGNSYGKYVHDANISDLEDAIEKQKLYWQILSILMVIALILVAIGVLAFLALFKGF